MALHVKSQVVGPGETALAMTAFEWFASGVLSEVSGQLIGSGETPLTALPRTLVRLLPCNEQIGSSNHVSNHFQTTLVNRLRINCIINFGIYKQ